MWGSRDPLLEFWDPPNISEMNEARNFKFGIYMDGNEYYRKKCKIRSKGLMWGSRDPLLQFWDPPNISRMNEARNFKFGSEMNGSEYQPKKTAKLGQNGSCGGHMTHFWNFGTP